MNYKELNSILPIDIIKYIGDYDNTSKERMNVVIQELNDYSDKIEEYESEQYYEWLLDEWEILALKKRDPTWGNKQSPYLLKYTNSKYKF